MVPLSPLETQCVQPIHWITQPLDFFERPLHSEARVLCATESRRTRLSNVD